MNRANSRTDAAECEFLAEDEFISIYPSFDDEESYKIAPGVEYGPFRANHEVEVPLWLAIYLKKANRCRIKYPEWLTVEVLTQCYILETQSEYGHDLAPTLPYFFSEITNLLLQHASNDTEDSISALRLALKNLTEAREVKILQLIHLGKFQTTGVIELTNFTNLEIMAHRGFFLQTINSLHSIRGVNNGVDPTTGQSIELGRNPHRPQ